MPYVAHNNQVQSLLAAAKEYTQEWRKTRAAGQPWTPKHGTSWPTVFSGAGRGKTRLLLELHEQLQHTAAASEFGACEVLALSLKGPEAKLSPEEHAGGLVLKAFTRNYTAPNASLLTVLSALRQRRNLPPAEPLTLLLLIDEANALSLEHLAELVRALLIPTYSNDPNCLVYLLLAGTHPPDNTLFIQTSRHRFTNHNIPLLSESDVNNLLAQLAAATKPSSSLVLHGEYQSVNAFRQLIRDASGWPRGIQVVLEFVSARWRNHHEDATEINYAELARLAHARIADLYPTLHTLPRGLITHALLGTPVAMTDNVGGLAVEDILARALATIVDGRLVMPFLWLAAHASKRRDPLAQQLCTMLCDPGAPAMEWKPFEDFVALALALRVAATHEQGKPLSALLFLKDVSWALDNSPRDVVFLFDASPRLPNREACWLERASAPWPLNTAHKRRDHLPNIRLQDGQLLNLRSAGCGAVVLNGTSAPFADIILSLPVQGRNLPFLVLLQCKCTKVTAPLTLSAIATEYNKCGDAWRSCKLAEHFSGWLLLVVTSSPAGDLPRERRAEFGESYLGIVSRENFDAFFGPTLSARAALAARLTLHPDTLTVSDVQQCGMSSPEATKVVTAARGGKLRSAQDLRKLELTERAAATRLEYLLFDRKDS